MRRRTLMTICLLLFWIFSLGCRHDFKPDFDTFLYRTGCVISHFRGPEETLDFFCFPRGAVFPELMKYQSILKKIKIVTIRNAFIDKDVYMLLRSCHQLQEVGFDRCCFSNDFLKRYFGTPGGTLEFVWFRECEFGPLLFDYLGERRNLKRIVIEGCRWVTAEGLEKLANTDTEREVSVVQCKPVTKADMKRLHEKFKDSKVLFTYSY